MNQQKKNSSMSYCPTKKYKCHFNLSDFVQNNTLKSFMVGHWF